MEIFLAVANIAADILWSVIPYSAEFMLKELLSQFVFLNVTFKHFSKHGNIFGRSKHSCGYFVRKVHICSNFNKLPQNTNVTVSHSNGQLGHN